MKSKLVLWGKDSNGQKVLIATELNEDTNKVTTYWFNDDAVTEDFNGKMLGAWRDHQAVEFPEKHGKESFELTLTGSIIPAGFSVDKDELLKRYQSECHFLVLSKKLNDSYNSELTEIKERLARLEKYEQSAWEELKGFWDKVQKQVQERNLLREQGNALRERTNELFTQLKELRTKLDEDFKNKSAALFSEFNESLALVDRQIQEGKRLKPIFEELKQFQKSIRDAQLTREHRSKIWDKLDKIFKIVKDKRFGEEGMGDGSAMERLQKRYAGLLEAIKKMEESIDRDKQDLGFQNKMVEGSEGQLEAQLRQAKVVMIEERVNSKSEKLKEMLSTKADLERRMNVEKDREQKRIEMQKVEEAKKEVQQKIAQEISEATSSVDPELAQKLEKAAEELKSRKKKKD
jgi:DNA repair exonuclease SbcCD ATPase subunit